jgi:glycosyltransferase involved in cell wall biosynthesis
MAGPLRVCFPFVGDTVGGAQMSTLSLIGALPQEIEPVVVTHGEGPLSQLLAGRTIEVRRLPLSVLAGRQPSPLSQLRAMVAVTPALLRFLKQNSVGVVHTQDGRTHASWWLAARLAGVPQVWHQRSRFSASKLFNFMIKRVAAVIANSEMALASLPPGVESTVIYNPVDTPSDTLPDHRADILGAAGIADAAIIAAIGNLRAVKQPGLLVEAVSVCSALTDRPLVLALFGEDREAWVPRMAAVLKATDGRARLVHMGFLHPIEPWLKSCDVLAATSNGDAFGRTLVEAMGVGVPVVAVDAGGHREIVTDRENGLLVTDDDAPALARAMAEVLGDKALRQRLTEAGRERAQDFAPSLHAAQIVSVYHAVHAR